MLAQMWSSAGFRQLSPALTLGLVLLPMLGCSSRVLTDPPPPPPRAEVDAIPVEAGGYADAFAFAKELLRDRGFTLERIDAREGIIVGRGSNSAGMATPWFDHTATPGAFIDATLNRERRVAVISFSPAGWQASEPAPDLREHPGPLELDVDVAVERTYVPLRRPSTASVRLTGSATSPEFSTNGLQPAYGITDRSDVDYAKELAKLIRENL